MRDSVRSFSHTAGECDEALRGAGFEPQGAHSTENDDEDGIFCPPPSAVVGGGGVISMRVNDRSLKIDVSSLDDESECEVGFNCLYDMVRRVFYARPMVQTSTCDPIDEDRSTKGAMSALLDVAEAYGARRITLGLGTEHACRAEFVCDLLYLSFQVSPARKSPWIDTSLLLDLDFCAEYDSFTGKGTSSDLNWDNLESMGSEFE